MPAALASLLAAPSAAFAAPDLGERLATALVEKMREFPDAALRVAACAELHALRVEPKSSGELLVRCGHTIDLFGLENSEMEASGALVDAAQPWLPVADAADGWERKPMWASSAPTTDGPCANGDAPDSSFCGFADGLAVLKALAARSREYAQADPAGFAVQKAVLESRVGRPRPADRYDPDGFPPRGYRDVGRVY